MSRKGVSPLIATVLLIAFALGVGSIFAQWAPELIQSTQSGISEQSDNIIKATDSGLDIVSASYDYNSGNVSIVFQNTGESDLSNLTVTSLANKTNQKQLDKTLSEKEIKSVDLKSSSKPKLVEVSHRELSVSDREDDITVDNGAADVTSVTHTDCSVNGTVKNVAYSKVDGYKQISTLEQLQCVNQKLDSKYQLAQDINATETENWNSGLGFKPIGSVWQEMFSGVLKGQGHKIDGLYIDRGGQDNIALVGYLGSNGELNRVAVTNVNFSGDFDVGGLVGDNDGGVVSQSYSTGSIYSNGNNIGGIVGFNSGNVSESYSHVNVSGGGNRGGLVGINDGGGNVSRSYSTGNVSGGYYIGGLISGSYDGSNVSNSYWDTKSSGLSTSDGGTGLTTSEMTGSSGTSNMSGFDFSSTWNAVETSDSDTLDEGYPILEALPREQQLKAQGVYSN